MIKFKILTEAKLNLEAEGLRVPHFFYRIELLIGQLRNIKFLSIFYKISDWQHLRLGSSRKYDYNSLIRYCYSCIVSN
jgi:hypothetical protein